jgi:cullin-associated NEDD8-dissociated protein 1
MGEVSNDPSLTEIFDVRSNELTFTRSEALRNQKKVVWTEIAVYGNDQLRQRMAWALAQIITTVPANIDAFDMTEIYIKYYDIIFVKHAFENFWDILAKTSYSPLMAKHLSYLKSKSHSYVYKVEKKRVVQADENFAREVMQLFSMGLILLNDGA